MSRGEFLSVLGLYHWDNTLFDEMVFPSDFTADNKQTVIGNILSECAELEILFPSAPICKAMIGLWSKLNLPVWERIYKASLKEYNPIENYNRTEDETISDDKKITHSGNDVMAQSGSDSKSLSSSGSETHSGTDSKTLSSSGSETHSGTDATLKSETNSGTDTTTTSETHSGIDATTNSQTAYDSGTQYIHDSSNLTHGHSISGSESVAHGHSVSGSDAITHGHKIDTTGNGGESTVHGHKVDTTESGTEGVTYGKKETMTHGEIIDHEGDITRHNHTTGNIGVLTSQQMLTQEVEVAPLLNVMNMICNSFKERFCILVY